MDYPKSESIFLKKKLETLSVTMNLFYIKDYCLHLPNYEDNIS